MNIAKKLITPSYAKQLLESNTKNRTVSESIVNKYAKDILEGKWKEDTFEFIKISKSNVILDGQHRLLAIIKADKAIYLQIANELEDSVLDVLDTGKSRSMVDIFRIQGIKNDNTIPSIIIRYRTLTKGRVKADSRSDNFTNAEILNFYNQHPLFWQSVAKKSIVWYSQFAKIISPATFGGFYSLFNDISPTHADEFMNQLATGNDIKCSSVKLLRTKLMNDKLSTKKMPLELRGAFMIKAWNSYRLNINPKILKWDSAVELFPKAI
jgi:hypothetical protein